MWPILLLTLLGVFLLIIELVVLPGISIAGVGALLTLGGAIFYGYFQYGLLVGSLIMAGIVLLVVAGVIVSLRSGTWKRLSLQEKIDAVALKTPLQNDITIGQQGESITRLAPMGKVEFGGKSFEARLLDGYLDPHQSVEAVAFENTVVIVKPIYTKPS